MKLESRSAGLLLEVREDLKEMGFGTDAPISGANAVEYLAALLADIEVALKDDGIDAVASVMEWSGSPDPLDPDNFWIDDETGERVDAKTGERSK